MNEKSRTPKMTESLPALTPRSAAAAAAARGLAGSNTANGASPKNSEPTVFCSANRLTRLDGNATFRSNNSIGTGSGGGGGTGAGGAASPPSCSPSSSMNPVSMPPLKQHQQQSQSQSPQQQQQQQQSSISPRGAGPAYSLAAAAAGNSNAAHSFSGGSTQIPTPPKQISPVRSPQPQLAPMNGGGGGGASSSAATKTAQIISQDQMQNAVLAKLDSLPRKGTFEIKS